MHPPVSWNVLSDGQPDNSTTLPIRMWSGGKNTGGLCSARSSIWAHTEKQPLLCIWLSAETAASWWNTGCPWWAKELGNHPVCEASLPQVTTGLESWHVICNCSGPHFKLMGKELENSIFLIPSPIFPHSPSYTRGCPVFVFVFLWVMNVLAVLI